MVAALLPRPVMPPNAATVPLDNGGRGFRVGAVGRHTPRLAARRGDRSSDLVQRVRTAADQGERMAAQGQQPRGGTDAATRTGDDGDLHGSSAAAALTARR